MMYGYGMGGLMWLWPLIAIIGLGVLVWALVRASSPSSRGTDSATDSPRSRSILEERFAQGEITEQEFRERLRVLSDR